MNPEILSSQPCPDLAHPSEDQENTNKSKSKEKVRSVQKARRKNVFPPKTPGKLSLRDLVGDPEDQTSQVPSATPHAQVTWKFAPRSPPSSASSAKRTQGSRKRAHSSSPASSHNRQSKHFKIPGDVNEERLHKSSQLELRQDEPAAALSQVGALPDGSDPSLPALPRNDRSPRTPNGSRKESSFRRTASCGNEWPTSNAKRRKLTHHDPHSTTKQIFATRKKDILKPELPQQSKVSLLLDTVQQSFVARAREQDEPSSSSPLPERPELDVKTDGFDYAVRKLTPSPFRCSQTRQPRPPASSPLKALVEESSDYGDLEIDEGDFHEIEVALTQAHVASESSTKSPGNTASTSNRLDSLGLPRAGSQNTGKPQGSPGPALMKRSTTVAAPRQVIDIFEDSDEEELTSELQNVASKRISPQKPATGCRVPDVVPVQPIAAFDGSFDDDCDEELMHELIIDDPKIRENAISKRIENSIDHRTIKRYLVLSVSESSYHDSASRKRPEKLLVIKDERTRQECVVSLRHSWYETPCTPGSFIHVLGEFNSNNQCIVDDLDNMIILHPDHLVSATVIGDAITCLRRAVLQDRVKATSPPVKSQVYGHMLHELFGEALKVNDWEWQTLEAIIARLLPNYLESLYEIGVQMPDAIEHLMSKVPLLRSWAELFVSAEIHPDALIRDRGGSLIPTAINKLLEVEEHVWSPMYGLKGNIDATVQAQMDNEKKGQPLTLVVPLELKTGMKDNKEAHRAQTALYTLLLSDRYDVEVTSGILYYMQTSKTFRIQGVRNEIRQMLIWRNLLASYVHNKLELPPMLKKEHMCKRCYAQTSCFIYHKLVESGDGETSAMKEVFDDAVGHLKPQHQRFFAQWDELLTKEERDSMKFRRELWTMLSGEREQVGRCFSNVIIEPGSASENLEGPKINRFTYCFIKHARQPDFSFTESQITVGEPIVVSDEKGHFALANGYVTSVRPRRVTVAVDRRLHNVRQRTKAFDARRNQSFVGIMDVHMKGPNSSPGMEENEPTLYRIDKDEFSNGMATVRNNLIRMMEAGLFKAKELRELIVDRKAPSFKTSSTAYSLSGPASQQNINVDQRAAIDKVMSAKDYALVLGMPGTGKTTTIAHIIRALVSQGKSVLLTSYTHTAVDNILLKIKNDNIPILRLGAVGKVHPDVQTFADLSGVPKKSLEELERSWLESKVVATTCLGINHGIFNHRIFDYCIVDEASQITLPVSVGPIRMAHCFILVGDHYQLPPLVQNKEAQDGGLDVSLFKLLSDAQPSSVVSLEHQYRMAEDIMLLSNQLIYNGRLKCGNSAVANRSLNVPSVQAALDAHHQQRNSGKHHSNTPAASQCSANHANCYLRICLLPTNRVLFLDTDTITQPESAQELLTGSNQRITNPTESLLVSHLLTTLIRAGVPARTIGVISFYRSQLALLRHDVKAIAGTTAASEVEMHTADKYQGRDKEVILLSCVRSNSANSVGELLKDWRRVNVAITRAKSKLLIIGSKSTLASSGVPVLEGLVRLTVERGWMLNLPEAATAGGHKFETIMPTQSQLPNVPALAVQRSGVVQQVQRKPLEPLDVNSTSHSHASQVKSSTKALALFKQPQKKPQPKKVVQGRIKAETLLDKHPVMRDVANEMMAPQTVYYDENDFDDDDDILMD